MRPVFVFCEGPHDIAFLGRLLKFNGATPYKESLRNYPSPLAGLIINRFQSRNIEEARFRSSGPFALDCPPILETAYTLPSPERLLLLYRCGGDKQDEAVKALLKTPIDLSGESNAPDNRIPSFGVVFVNDADMSPVSETLDRVRTAYCEVLKPILSKVDQLQANGTIRENGFACGCLIFSDSEEQAGTLESIIEPIMRKQQSARHDDADVLVSKHATVDTAAGNTKRPSKKRKALLTAAGQIDFPSCSLSVIIRDTAALKWEDLKNDPRCTKCVEVLTRV